MKGALLLGLAFDQPRGLALAQQHERAIDQIERFPGVLVAALGFLRQPISPPLQAVEIGEHQFGLDRLDIGDRIDAPFDMGHGRILETTHPLRDRIDFTDIGEE